MCHWLRLILGLMFKEVVRKFKKHLKNFMSYVNQLGNVFIQHSVVFTKAVNKRMLTTDAIFV